MPEAIIFDLKSYFPGVEVSTGSQPASYTMKGIPFEEAFKTHFKSLHVYAFTIIEDDVMAEEIVQNVFCRLWEKNSELVIQQSLKAYLYKSVYHESLNYLKHLKVREAHKAHVARQSNFSEDGFEHTSLKELQERLDKALKELPQQCRTIFQMSRYEDMKYQEIASSLEISVKTVENQMGKALKTLRQKLADLLPAILIILLNL